ncbi:MAG: MFS transporter [bacterium]
MRQILIVLVLWCAGLGAAAQFGKISILYQDLERHYASAGPVGIGFMVSIVGIVGLIFGTSAGLLVSRIGARRAILWALGLGAVVSVVQSFLPPYPVMMATRLLEGVSHLTIVVVGPAAIAAVAPRHLLGAAMALWSTFFGLTFAILAYVAPPFVAWFGDPALFWAHAVWMVGMLGLLSALMPEDVRQVVPQGGPGLFRQHLAIYASPFLGAPAMGFVCYTVTYVALLTLLPAAATPGWGGFVAVAMPLLSIVTSLTLGVWLLSRMAAVRVVQSGFALGIVASVALWLFWGSGLMETAAILLLSVAVGLMPGPSFAAMAQLNPSAEDRARASGAIAQLGNLGTTTGTPVMAIILAKTGVTGLSLFLATVYALGILIHALQARRRVSG